jgi:hypothetical protein
LLSGGFTGYIKISDMRAEANPIVIRIFGTLGFALMVLLAIAEIWWFYGFTRHYFPNATITSATIRAVVCLSVSGYFVAAVVKTSWKPWAKRK